MVKESKQGDQGKLHEHLAKGTSRKQDGKTHAEVIRQVCKDQCRTDAALSDNLPADASRQCGLHYDYNEYTVCITT